MPITAFDHVALPTSHPEELIDFYGGLGFLVPDLDEWRSAELPFFSVFFGSQKINFHTPAMWQNPDFQLRGPSSAPGCGDLCFVWEGGSPTLQSLLEAAGVAIIAGPIDLHGAAGRGTSVYVRDPDENLLEFIVYDE
ncbi:MAG: VOC family virulence protein [Deltaproteobacteria bacterium]|jgi:catechol 2,3-dioxygenase-like lactoylglutathione lyase family enzyme|nr:VOC family virulence protein [Deltaproteobacteria bacterium]